MIFSLFVVLKKQLKEGNMVSQTEKQFSVCEILRKTQKDVHFLAETISSEEIMIYQYALFPLEVKYSSSIPNDSIQVLIVKGEVKNLPNYLVKQKQINDSIALYQRED